MYEIITSNSGSITGFIMTAAASIYLGYRLKIRNYNKKLMDQEREILRLTWLNERKESTNRVLQKEISRLKEHAKVLEAVVEDYNDKFYLIDEMNKKVGR
jgi:hypothetical protein